MIYIYMYIDCDLNESIDLGRPWQTSEAEPSNGDRTQPSPLWFGSRHGQDTGQAEHQKRVRRGRKVGGPTFGVWFEG